jgi:hypothetical protein
MMMYFEIASSIERLEYQTAIINQIFYDKRHIRLTKKFENEGVEIIKNTKSKNFKIKVDLIK